MHEMPDRMRYSPSMAAISLKYDILLEKPLAPSVQECLKIMWAAQENGVLVIVYTVLRYTPLFCTVKVKIESRRIGEVISIHHEEVCRQHPPGPQLCPEKPGQQKRNANMLLPKF